MKCEIVNHMMDNEKHLSELVSLRSQFKQEGAVGQQLFPESCTFMWGFHNICQVKLPKNDNHYKSVKHNES